jgi:hypothetical protein
MENYSVKGIKTFMGMEGQGFNATLCRGTKQVALVIDDASGGEVEFQWLDHKEPSVDIIHRLFDGSEATYKGSPEEKLFMDFVKVQPDWEYDGKKHPMSDEVLIGDMVNKALQEKEFYRLDKKCLLFVKPDCKKGEYCSFKRKNNARHFGQSELVAFLHKKYPTAIVIETFADWERLVLKEGE